MQSDFDVLTPGTLSEALTMLSEQRPHARPIAGGTNIVVGMRHGAYRDGVLVDISRLKALRGIRLEDGYLVLGAGTTLATVLESPLVAEHGSPLHQCARVFANPLVRNRATVAGNLVDASPAADTGPALLVLDAQVDLQGPRGSRRVPLSEFLVGPNQTTIRPGELVVSLRWPVPPARSAGAFRKIGLRKGSVCSVVSAAVMVQLDDKGICQSARIALGAVAPAPIRVPAAEKLLLGRDLQADLIAHAGELAWEAAKPISDLRGSADYRRRAVAVLVRRSLTQAADELG